MLKYQALYAKAKQKAEQEAKRLYVDEKRQVEKAIQLTTRYYLEYITPPRGNRNV
jgi:hypothetical protein